MPPSPTSSATDPSSIPSRDSFIEHFATKKRVRGYDVQTRSSESSRYSSASSSGNLFSVAWNCDGTMLAVGSSEKVVAAATLEQNGKFRQTFTGSAHTDTVDKVAWHPTSPSLFASASSDRSICIWDTRQKGKPGRLSTKSANQCVAWSPCGQYLVVGDKDERLSLVEGRTFSVSKTTDYNRLEVNEFAYDPSGKYLLVALGQGKLGIMDMPTLQPWRTIQAHSPQSSCISLSISASGGKLALGASDALVSLWDADELICERVISRLDYIVRAVSFSHDGHLLAAGSEDHTVDVAYVHDASRIHGISTDAETFSVAWHPKAHLLAFTSTPAERDSRDRDHRELANRLRVFGFNSSS